MEDPPANNVLGFPRRVDRRPRPREGRLLTFEEALAENLDSLYATARRIVRDPTQVDDLVQEVALKAYRSFQDLRSHDRFRAWLFTILQNTARNLGRDASRRTGFVDLDLDALLEDPLLAGTAASSPEELLLETCLSEDLEAGLDALPDPLLRVLWLVDVEEFTVAEAADILGVPTGTAASRLHRARRALREHVLAAGRKPPRGKGGVP